MTWRTDKNDNRFKVESGESDIQDAIDNLLNEPNLKPVPRDRCSECGSGFGEMFPVSPYENLCESCFLKKVKELGIDDNPSLQPIQPVQSQVARSSDVQLCSRCGMRIENYGRGGSREHWAKYHANESA